MTRRAWSAIAALLAVTGIVVVVLALVPATQTPPTPTPETEQVAAPNLAPSGPASAAVRAPTGPVLSRSVPVRLDIDAIGVHSSLLQLGVNPDQTLQVPPLEADSRAGWFNQSPTPGELGPSVLLGHVDSAQYGPGVFFQLGAMTPGQVIRVTRADATVAEFVVDRVVTYAKASFPSLEVYGNTADAQLRLITCGGVFDRASGDYADNIVVYAHLVGSHPV